MHRAITRGHFEAPLVVNLFNLIRLNVHVVGRSQLVIVLLGIVLV